MTEILVVGGTGKTGRRVAAGLRERGFTPRVASRSSARRFDWADERTWLPALSGVGAAYLVGPQGGNAAERLRPFAELAVAHGVERLVLLSARAWAELDDAAGLAAEQAVRESGAAWTILRPTWFAQNFSEDRLLVDAVAEGEVRLATGEGREPFVDLEDVAEVAVAAMTKPGHDGQVYELSGPDALTWGEAVDEIARAAGRPLRFTAVSGERNREELVARGYPAEFAAAVVALFEHIGQGRSPGRSDGVRRALGREPGSFRAYAQRTARFWRDQGRGPAAERGGD
ncbi:NAD(P)H-binding protein [Nonomuraea africana]|uniref:NAD(P)H-binding protein n=1 Tax=Nonomuraea africana TaxID=46171 RepID=UPI00340857A7